MACAFASLARGGFNIARAASHRARIAGAREFASYKDMNYTRLLLQKKSAYIIDCDGVLYHGDHLLPGAKEFVDFLHSDGKRFVFLTNASDRSPEQLAVKFDRIGIAVEPEHFYTSAISTAMFLATQKYGARVYMLGEDGLRAALEAEGITVVDRGEAERSTPDFFVVGETMDREKYNYEEISFAVKLVRRGARLIGTNEDTADRHGPEMIPGVGSLVLPIEAASGFQAYFVGKPNPLMVASALTRLEVSREEAVVVGDRMNTDIKAGVEASVDTILVLSGVTHLDDIKKFAYRPSTILTGVGDIPALVHGNASKLELIPAEIKEANETTAQHIPHLAKTLFH